MLLQHQQSALSLAEGWMRCHYLPMDLCQHRISSKFLDAVQLPVIATMLLHS